MFSYSTGEIWRILELYGLVNSMKPRMIWSPVSHAYVYAWPPAEFVVYMSVLVELGGHYLECILAIMSNVMTTKIDKHQPKSKQKLPSQEKFAKIYLYVK